MDLKLLIVMNLFINVALSMWTLAKAPQRTAMLIAQGITIGTLLAILIRLP